MFLERPVNDNQILNKSRKITFRVPKKLWLLVQEKAKKEYKGKGKQSKLVNEALEHFFKNSSVDDINWDNISSDYILINFLTQIRLGANVKNIGHYPVQANILNSLYDKLNDLEINVRKMKEMLDVRVKPAILRMSLSQWLYADRNLIRNLSDVDCPSEDKITII